MKRYFTYLKSSFFVVFIAIFMAGCFAQKEQKVFQVKDNFNIYDFTGTWYEVGSTKNSSNLSDIKVNFAVDNGKIRVVKTGHLPDGSSKKEQFLARFGLDDKNASMLEISRYGLIYEPLYIVRNDRYQYAMMYIGNKDISIVSRAKTIPEVVRVIYKDKAKSDGFDIGRIEWIKQR
ncbi:lipocalin family protein [Campylobacter corcagiensis]|uniref:Lipocalin family protein n=1 Tax=Campylobacter corcagiensis TaxID=1448857 RepID=A0A7M1LHI2_9BACT|nr:lipocalin family protein [Campylobacter corcagiensis]QKF64885.1 lipocalin domain-containing protein [Campylobacter corcagiensis]QOQ86955.1 lipocalin family protein [Campylobacter corcagiensis]